MTDDGLDVLHVDMDCFFAAVEVLDDPSLVGLPVVVGGTGTRGVVAACSYEARMTGVRSAMPIGEARRRCPGARFIAGRHGRYSEVSAKIHEVFREFTPIVEPIGLDEAFLDVTGGHRLFGSSEAIGRAVRSRMSEVLRLDCSVGVARSKLIAKLASREAKPRATRSGVQPGPGVVVVREEEELSFLQPRPVRDLWGVGPKTAERLKRYGITTIGDIAALDESALCRLLGRAAGQQLHELSCGRDARRVESGQDAKSIGHEETFPRDRHRHEQLQPEVVRLSDSVGSRLRSAGLTGRTVTLKLKFADFSLVTRSHSLDGPLLSSTEIARIAAVLLEGVDVGTGVRLLGVSVSGLERSDVAGGRQLSLVDLIEFDSPAPDDTRSRPSAPARAEVEAAVDAIRSRYGAAAVGPATVVDREKGLRVKELGDAQWG